MKKLAIYFSFIILLIVGVCFLFFGIKYKNNNEEFKKNAVETTAFIYQNIISGNKQVVYIRYTIGEDKYNGILSSYNKKKYGSSIKIYYDKNNPRIYKVDNNKNEWILFVFLGSVLMLISISFIARMYIYEK